MLRESTKSFRCDMLGSDLPGARKGAGMTRTDGESEVRMQTEHGDRIDVLVGLGGSVILRVLDTEDRMSIARFTQDETDELMNLWANVAEKAATRHRGPPISDARGVVT